MAKHFNMMVIFSSWFEKYQKLKPFGGPLNFGDPLTLCLGALSIAISIVLPSHEPPTLHGVLRTSQVEGPAKAWTMPTFWMPYIPQSPHILSCCLTAHKWQIPWSPPGSSMAVGWRNPAQSREVAFFPLGHHASAEICLEEFVWIRFPYYDEYLAQVNSKGAKV